MQNNFVVVDKEELTQMIQEAVDKKIDEYDKQVADFIKRKFDNLKITY